MIVHFANPGIFSLTTKNVVWKNIKVIKIPPKLDPFNIRIPKIVCATTRYVVCEDIKNECQVKKQTRVRSLHLNQKDAFDLLIYSKLLISDRNMMCYNRVSLLICVCLEL